MDTSWRWDRWLWGIVGLALATTVQALGLGDAQLMSFLNEPLQARIPLRLAPGEDLDRVRVALASEQAFSMLHIPQNPLAYQIRFEVVKGASPYIMVQAPTVVKDPIVQFPLQVTYGEGSSLIRGYTLFLKARALGEGGAPTASQPTEPASALSRVQRQQDSNDQGETNPSSANGPLSSSDRPTSGSPALSPRQANPSSSSRPAPSAQQESWPDETLPAPLRATSLSEPQQPTGESPSSGAVPATTMQPIQKQRRAELEPNAGHVPDAMPTRYGPIHPGETLFQVARAIQPHYDGISEARLAAALYRKNPRAFRLGNPGGLMKGSFLSVPTQEEVAAIHPAQASAILRGSHELARREPSRSKEKGAQGSTVSSSGKSPSPAGMAQSGVPAQPMLPAQAGVAVVHKPDQNKASVAEKATQGRSSLPATMPASPAGVQPLQKGTQQSMGSTEKEQGLTNEVPAGPGATLAAKANDESPDQTDQTGQPMALPTQQPGPKAGPSVNPVPPGVLGPIPPEKGPSAGHEGEQPLAPQGSQPQAHKPAVPPTPPQEEKQVQQTRPPEMPPPAQHQEGLRRRANVPWYVKLAVGIVGVACVLVGLIVFLSRRQRVRAVSSSGQASRDRKGTAADLNAHEVGAGSAEAMQQASELMACGLYQDARTILENALALDGGNHTLHLKLLEAIAALGQFDEVRRQARLLEDFNLDPAQRATLEHLLQALPQPDPSLPDPGRSVYESKPQQAEALESPSFVASGAAGGGTAALKAGEQGLECSGQDQDEAPFAISPKDKGQGAPEDGGYERWLKGSSAGLSSAEDPAGAANPFLGATDETTPTPPSQYHGGDVDWKPYGLSEEAARIEEGGSGLPGDAWHSPEQAAMPHHDQAMDQSPHADEQQVERFDWPASSERNELMPNEGSSPEVQGGIADRQGGLTSVSEERPAPPSMPRSEDQQRARGELPSARASVLAKPWENQPSISNVGSPDPSWPGSSQQEGHSIDAVTQGQNQVVPWATPSQAVTETFHSSGKKTGPLDSPGLDWQAMPPSAMDQDIAGPEGASPAPAFSMPAYEWPSQTDSNGIAQEVMYEEGEQRSASRDQGQQGQQNLTSGQGNQPEDDFSAIPTRPAADDVPGSPSAEDVDRDQEQQVWGTYGHWGQPSQTTWEQEALVTEGTPAMEWASADQLPPSSWQEQEGEERAQPEGEPMPSDSSSEDVSGISDAVSKTKLFGEDEGHLLDGDVGGEAPPDTLSHDRDRRDMEKQKTIAATQPVTEGQATAAPLATALEALAGGDGGISQAEHFPSDALPSKPEAHHLQDRVAPPRPGFTKVDAAAEGELPARSRLFDQLTKLARQGERRN